MLCPEGAIRWRPDLGKIEINPEVCMGCGICAKECPTKAIKMTLEQE